MPRSNTDPHASSLHATVTTRWSSTGSVSWWLTDNTSTAAKKGPRKYNTPPQSISKKPSREPPSPKRYEIRQIDKRYSRAGQRWRRRTKATQCEGNECREVELDVNVHPRDNILTHPPHRAFPSLRTVDLVVALLLLRLDVLLKALVIIVVVLAVDIAIGAAVPY